MIHSQSERRVGHNGSEIIAIPNKKVSSKEFWTMIERLIQLTRRGKASLWYTSKNREDNDVTYLLIPTNLVPAVAVIREGLTFFNINGSKAYVGCIIKQ